MTVLKVRMDRGRDFSTVHGERTPGDVHAAVHFYQDRLPFDSNRFLIVDHPDILKDPKLQALVEKKLKKAEKAKPVAAAEGTDALSDDNTEVDDDEDEEILDPVNLEMWARGESEYPWTDVSQAIAQRFKRRVPSKAAAIEFLVDEKIIAVADLSKAHQKLVKELV
jgi:hypothetical protein